MKQLIYIDNDNDSRASKDLKDYVIPSLSAYSGLDVSESDFKVIPDLYKQDKDTLCHLLFDKDNVIVSWSVYTPTAFHNSKQQLFHFLRVAGGAGVTGATYIDASGMIGKVIEHIPFDEPKNCFDILCAFTHNHIITKKDGFFARIRIQLDRDNICIYEEINLSDTLSN